MDTELLTTAEAATRLGLTVRAVQKMIEAERLSARKVGRDYLIEPAALKDIPRQAAGRPPKTARVENRPTGQKNTREGTSTRSSRGRR